MEVTAQAKNVRVSPKKVKLVVDQIKKMPPAQAVKILDFVQKASSPILKKVILSAIANARNNYGLSEESLSFKEIQVGKGIVFKRYRPISRGRAHSILKRTSHVRIVLEGEQKKEVSNVSQVPEVPKAENTKDKEKK